MPRIQLRVYTAPGQAEVFVNIKRKDGGYYTRAGVVDTGAQTSLLPEELTATLDYRLSERGSFMVEQAGIAQQAFKAVEAYVSLFLEDQTGARTEEFEARVWFARTRHVLIGFDGILDRAVLHLDMTHLTGYLDFAS
jgi:hypothetical protein